MTLIELIGSSAQHDISLEDAAVMTAAYRTNNPGKKIGGLFNIRIFLAILAQDNCMGIRYYFAEKENGDITLVLTGADQELNDISDGQLGEVSMPCPNICADPNALNGL